MNTNYAEKVFTDNGSATKSINVKQQAIEAIDRIINGNPIVISKKGKLIFKNIAKEARVSPTELHRDFRDVMLYVSSLKDAKNESITIHASLVRKRCMEAIERFKTGETRNVNKNAKVTVASVAKEADVSDSYLYAYFPDILNKINELQGEYARYGNKEKHDKLLKALTILLSKNEVITVKKVCREAGFSETFDMMVRKSYPDAHNQILIEIEKQKISKHTQDRLILLEALERLKSGNPKNTSPIPNGGYISVRKLMNESGIGEGVIKKNHPDIYQECLKKITIKNEDVWLVKSDFDAVSKGDTETHKLNFSNIHFDWLISSAKAFIKAVFSTRSKSTLKINIDAITFFSRALYSINPECEAHEVTRSEMQKVFFEWSKSELKSSTIKRRLASLRQYFEWCEDTNFIKFGETKLIRDTDYPSLPKSTPKFIPENVMSQLNQHIDKLNPDVMRFFLVLQEVGMRISECCSLMFNCISPDENGDYFLKYYQFKMKKDHIIPISAELVSVIREQQKAMIAEFGQAPVLLFTTPKFQENGVPYPRAGKAWSKGTLIKNLNTLAVENNINDASGKVIRFGFHQFRHTVATRMINNGVPQHIVQKYLGHETPVMTSTYAHILDETLKKEFKKFNSTMIDINGKKFNDQDIINDLTMGTDANNIDAQWLKKNIAMQTLPNGLCSLPVVQGGCPHANACLTCSNFRTDHTFLPQHKEQLQRTEVIIETCKKNGWVRQLEMNENIKESLVKIIAPLESN